jgi:hypothetical protein
VTVISVVFWSVFSFLRGFIQFKSNIW